MVVIFKSGIERQDITEYVQDLLKICIIGTAINKMNFQLRKPIYAESKVTRTSIDSTGLLMQDCQRGSQTYYKYAQ